MVFFHIDCSAPPLKSKSKPLSASESTPATTSDLCTPTPLVQTSTPAPSAPEQSSPEPGQEETAPADVDDPQPDDGKAEDIKKDGAESEVGQLYFFTYSNN